MSNKILKVLLITILFMLTFIGVSAAATTVNEKASDYEGEVYIIGSTRFENTIITAEKAAMAGVNEARLYTSLNKDLRDLNLKLYFYDADFKDWYVVTEEWVNGTNPTPLTTEKVDELGLNNLEIFFVNNEEKTLEFNYEADKTKVEIDEYSAKEGVKYDGKKFTVPATVLNFSFTENGATVNVDTKIDEKLSSEEGLAFDYGKFNISKTYAVNFILRDDEDNHVESEYYIEAGNTFVYTQNDELPIAEYKDGYEFLGWFEKDSEVAFTTSTVVNKNYTLYPRYLRTASTEEDFKAAIEANVESLKLESDLTLSSNIQLNGNTTIDLNGKTITSQNSDKGFTITGDLTLNDNTKQGKVENMQLTVKGGKLTLKDITVDKNVLDSDGTGYAIYARDGGTVVVDGAVINSVDSPLSGNNTTGKANFTIKSGTLTATQGPAIYMPGDGVINISGGTLNGGLSIRMGEINISGGTINATKGEIDDFKQYYKYSGNAWFADAIYVWNGSYQFNNETATLKLNITGGTFNCENGKGRAIAIYDLGRYEQNTTVKVSNDAILKTNAENTEAFQVLSFEDMGVTLPENSPWGKYHIDMSKIEK